MDNPFLALPPIPTYPDLTRKVVIVTGIGQVGSPGIALWGNGAATACAFARQGCKIFGCDLNLEAAENTKNRIKHELTATGFNKASLDITVTKCDVTKEGDVKDLVQECIETYGRIDILIKYGPIPISLCDAELSIAMSDSPCREQLLQWRLKSGHNSLTSI